jgi:peptidoglycan/LPS O-acetylase OafA/YrhL
MFTIRRTTDHRTMWLLAFCLIALCLGASALGAWQNRAMTDDRLLIAYGIHIVAPEILIPKPPPPDGVTAEEEG